MEKCSCGSGKDFQKCCDIFLSGQSSPSTAEELMRARYTAYATGDVDFIINTHNPGERDSLSRDDVEQWSKKSEWLGLEILDTVNGTGSDSSGSVEFKAQYMQNRERYTHHEIAGFSKLDGKWYFMDGKIQNEPVVRENPKVGRNDLCPCGSGKKYKKCCG